MHSAWGPLSQLKLDRHPPCWISGVWQGLYHSSRHFKVVCLLHDNFNCPFSVGYLCAHCLEMGTMKRYINVLNKIKYISILENVLLLKYHGSSEHQANVSPRAPTWPLKLINGNRLAKFHAGTNQSVWSKIISAPSIRLNYLSVALFSNHLHLPLWEAKSWGHI